jgi:extradiol dioxygenase family protein
MVAWYRRDGSRRASEWARRKTHRNARRKRGRPVTSASDEPILHISLPVCDLGESRRFYVDVLGCEPGRVQDRSIDVFFFGSQVTLHERPGEVLDPQDSGVRHFGVTLSRDGWREVVDRLRRGGTAFVHEPTTDYAGTPREQLKAMVADPSGNAIEIKTYTDWRAALLCERNLARCSDVDPSESAGEEA